MHASMGATGKRRSTSGGWRVNSACSALRLHVQEVMTKGRTAFARLAKLTKGDIATLRGGVGAAAARLLRAERYARGRQALEDSANNGPRRKSCRTNSTISGTMQFISRWLLGSCVAGRGLVRANPSCRQAIRKIGGGRRIVAWC